MWGRISTVRRVSEAGTAFALKCQLPHEEGRGLIRTTSTALGLSQTEFAGRFRVPVGTLRDWEQARVSPPDFAVAYVKVIGKFPEMVAKAVA